MDFLSPILQRSYSLSNNSIKVEGGKLMAEFLVVNTTMTSIKYAASAELQG